MSFFFGLLVGSFLNVLIYRIPRKIGFVFLRSRCESCQKLIRWYQNIPLVSFVFLRGKCESCGEKISYRHPLVELLVGMIFYVLFPEKINASTMAFYLFYLAIFCALVVHFFIDLDFQILPDGVNAYLALLFLSYSLLFHSWQHWLFGALIGFSIPYAMTWVFYQLRGKIGMGGGDFKLYAALGLYLGPQGILMNLFLSCFLGSVVGVGLILLRKIGRDTPIAFGPFIIIAAIGQIFFPGYQDLLTNIVFLPNRPIP